MHAIDIQIPFVNGGRPCTILDAGRTFIAKPDEVARDHHAHGVLFQVHSDAECRTILPLCAMIHVPKDSVLGGTRIARDLIVLPRLLPFSGIAHIPNDAMVVCLAWDLVEDESPPITEGFHHFDRFEWFGAGLSYRSGVYDCVNSRYDFLVDDGYILPTCCEWCKCGRKEPRPPLVAVSINHDDGCNEIQLLFDVRGMVDPDSPACKGYPNLYWQAKTFFVDKPASLLPSTFWTLASHASVTILHTWWQHNMS